jgi:hypothetical protein
MTRQAVIRVLSGCPLRMARQAVIRDLFPGRGVGDELAGGRPDLRVRVERAKPDPNPLGITGDAAVER